MNAGTDPDKTALLTVAEMYRADALTIDAGTPGLTLMENAGRAVADRITARWAAQDTVVLCGPGNNGGDGFVIARVLAEAGWPVRVVSLVAKDVFSGDARVNAGLWQGPFTVAAGADDLGAATLVVDALFGAGLSREVDGLAAGLLRACEAGRQIVAVDMPSGVHGDTGAVLGYAPRADLTVTFFRRKCGHVLMPGRVHCGPVEVVDIGIPDTVLNEVAPQQVENNPAVWRHMMQFPTPASHKYTRGYALVVGGQVLTGASRLAARAAQRAGAGAVGLAAPVDAQTVYKVALESVMVQPFRDTASLRDLVENPKLDAVLIGPGAGQVTATRERASMVLRSGKPAVLDADALSVFEGAPELLHGSVTGPAVLTPHEGEFSRMFPDLTGGRLIRVRAAAARSGGVVLLKGYDTTIAAPDGRLAVTTNATPDLATAGAGDVLAGIIVGLLAQGTPAFEAACAGAWIHGAAGAAFGPGLIAEDLVGGIPAVLRLLKD